ncbi:hypothetical protein N7463_005414 [Penicillium fimorum]|uniref:Myb-like DNA-binding domain-containing protein n=1 Tax=Penicillium fimorum TaxID=1882269 RepID=A0A9W9XSG9_9EURO|nr:hypothetical protein N7463_005414 [Penicillium fimorum]
MGQRNKVLETDTPTAKFLYTIIKQLDLKSVDWNRVASDIEVSNGHAARMRYSRFRQQMEGNTGASKPKRKAKKGKTIEPPAEMQGIFPMAPPLMMPTMESTDSSLPGNPFVKCEPGTQGNANLQSFPQNSPQLMLEASTEAQYYFPQDFASMQFQLALSIPSGISSPSPTSSSSFINPYQLGRPYPYSSPSIQSGFDLQEFEQLNPFTNYAPTVTWEPRPPSRQEGPTVKIEEQQQIEINLALVAKVFGYASGKSFQKKYAKLKKAHKLTNGQIYGDGKPEISSTEGAPTEVAQTPPNETIKATKSIMDIANEHIRLYLAQRYAVDKSESSEEKQKKHS